MKLNISQYLIKFLSELKAKRTNQYEHNFGRYFIFLGL